MRSLEADLLLALPKRLTEVKFVLIKATLNADPSWPTIFCDVAIIGRVEIEGRGTYPYPVTHYFLLYNLRLVGRPSGEEQPGVKRKTVITMMMLMVRGTD